MSVALRWNYVPGPNSGLAALGDTHSIWKHDQNDDGRQPKLSHRQLTIAVPWLNRQSALRTSGWGRLCDDAKVTPNYNFAPEIMTDQSQASKVHESDAGALQVSEAASLIAAAAAEAPTRPGLSSAAAAAAKDKANQLIAELYNGLALAEAVPGALGGEGQNGRPKGKGKTKGGKVKGMRRQRQAAEPVAPHKPSKHLAIVTEKARREPWSPERRVTTRMVPLKLKAQAGLAYEPQPAAWIPSGSEFLQKQQRMDLLHPQGQRQPHSRPAPASCSVPYGRFHHSSSPIRAAAPQKAASGKKGKKRGSVKHTDGQSTRPGAEGGNAVEAVAPQHSYGAPGVQGGGGAAAGLPPCPDAGRGVIWRPEMLQREALPPLPAMPDLSSLRQRSEASASAAPSGGGGAHGAADSAGYSWWGPDAGSSAAGRRRDAEPAMGLGAWTTAPGQREEAMSRAEGQADSWREQGQGVAGAWDPDQAPRAAGGLWGASCGERSGSFSEGVPDVAYVGGSSGSSSYEDGVGSLQARIAQLQRHIEAGQQRLSSPPQALASQPSASKGHRLRQPSSQKAARGSGLPGAVVVVPSTLDQVNAAAAAAAAVNAEAAAAARSAKTAGASMSTDWSFDLLGGLGETRAMGAAGSAGDAWAGLGSWETSPAQPTLHVPPASGPGGPGAAESASYHHHHQQQQQRDGQQQRSAAAIQSQPPTGARATAATGPAAAAQLPPHKPHASLHGMREGVDHAAVAAEVAALTPLPRFFKGLAIQEPLLLGVETGCSTGAAAEGGGAGRRAPGTTGISSSTNSSSGGGGGGGGVIYGGARGYAGYAGLGVPGMGSYMGVSPAVVSVASSDSDSLDELWELERLVEIQHQQLVSRGLIPTNTTNLGPASQARVASDVAGSTESDDD